MYYVLLALTGIALLGNILEYKYIYRDSTSETFMAWYRLADVILMLIAVLLSIVSFVFFVLWLRRAYFNLHISGVKELQYSEGWAAGGWFIPFANFIIPYRIVKDTWTGVSTVVLTDKEKKDMTIIGWWWLAYLGGSFLGNSSRAETVSELRAESAIDGMSDILTITYLVLGIRIINYVSSWEELNYNYQLLQPTQETNAEAEVETARIRLAYTRTPNLEDYSLFKRFDDSLEAVTLVELLSSENIQSKIVEDTMAFDATFSTGNTKTEFQVMIKQTDFKQASLLLLKFAAEEVNSIPPEYYLFNFTEEELQEILSRPDEWSELDYQLARKILKEKGNNIDEADLEERKEKRLVEIAKPEKSQTGWIIFSYVIALLGGFLAVFIGWYLWNCKKILPNGSKVFAYSDSNRKHGRIIFYIGLTIGIISLFIVINQVIAAQIAE